ncbi:MAG: NRDE family protein [Rhodocyclaceae bacterium]|nr:MAG: NRDE family protein [Rhodocyclaceae bacterium]
MCLILLAWQAHEKYPLVLAANRDEFFARPTAAADSWDDAPDVLAGRDLSAGGTWMGITRQGRFAALTNFREPEKKRTEAPSRGRLVSDFLAGSMTAIEYLDELSQRSDAFNGFNLLCGNLTGELWHFSNRIEHGQPHRLTAGIYGLSNHLLDTPWPKVAQGKSNLAIALAALPKDRPLFELLRDADVHDDAHLPRTGLSLEWERVLSAAFVRTPDYGTRSSTVLCLDRLQFLSFDEQTWLPGAQPGERRRFHFKLEGSAPW